MGEWCASCGAWPVRAVPPGRRPRLHGTRTRCRAGNAVEGGGSGMVCAVKGSCVPGRRGPRGAGDECGRLGRGKGRHCGAERGEGCIAPGLGAAACGASCGCSPPVPERGVGESCTGHPHRGRARCTSPGGTLYARGRRSLRGSRVLRSPAAPFGRPPADLKRQRHGRAGHCAAL